MKLKGIHKVYLGSKSPRRQELLKGMGIDFELQLQDVEEHFPESLKAEEIPLYLCKLKAQVLKPLLKPGELLITADTVVWINNHVLNKPSGFEEAFAMLKEIQGNTHSVFTAVNLSTVDSSDVFFVESKVTFNPLSDWDIKYYLDNYKPYDKAGSYGVQEWIGYVGIRKIEGSYTNVVGLPTAELFTRLREKFGVLY